jgi:hypothetical protein
VSEKVERVMGIEPRAVALLCSSVQSLTGDSSLACDLRVKLRGLVE